MAGASAVQLYLYLDLNLHLYLYVYLYLYLCSYSHGRRLCSAFAVRSGVEANANAVLEHRLLSHAAAD